MKVVHCVRTMQVKQDYKHNNSGSDSERAKIFNVKLSWQHQLEKRKRNQPFDNHTYF